MIGESLGPYKILEPLGAGGMGEVYLGEDTRLGRKVAIKVLPQEFASDPERLARFEQEARAAAALNHPLTGVNIFVTEEGHAKVLDFGLAKLTEMAAPVGGDATMSPTMLGTVAGQVMGTAGYMAPEQVNGEEVDQRADLFAFGSVLYETITGRQAFAGKSIPDTLSRILHDEPGPLVEVDESLPFELQRIVKKCLAKDRAKRYQTAGDLVVDLQTLAADVESGAAMPVGGEQLGAPISEETTRGIPWKLAIPIAIASALLAAFGVWITIPSPAEPLLRRFDIDYPPETAFRRGTNLGVAISPDGKSVVFNDDRQLWLRAIDNLVATPIRGTERATTPFFSPDGQRLGFGGGAGQIKSVSITGGAPTPLGPVSRLRYGASWADDGYIYFGQGSGGILRLSENGGEPQVVVEMAQGDQARGPQLLPGGEWLLFTRLSGAGPWNGASIVVQPVSGGEPKVLVAGGTDGRYVPTGHIVYFLEGDLFAVPFDADSMEVTGGSILIVEGIRQAGLTGAGEYAFSDRGGLVYVSGGAEDDFQLAWVDRDGAVELLPFEPRPSWNLELSPDDQRIALEIQGDRGFDVWIYEVERGGSRVLLTGEMEGSSASPVWSPDGEWVFFASGRGGNYFDIWKRPADRSLAAELVLDMEARVQPQSISADGEKLLFVSGVVPNRDVGILTLDTDQPPEMLVATAADERFPNFSPDGRFFVFHSNETGQYEVYVREVESGRTFPVSTSSRGGSNPRWSRDGGEIFFGSSNSAGILVANVALEPFSASDPVELSDIRRHEWSNFAVTADGQKFLVTVPVDAIDTGDAALSPRINVVLNWFEELKRKVPTGR